MDIETNKKNFISNNFKSEIIKLIDEIKSVCADAGLGNSGYEYQIITEIFLYKFLNDKFIYEIKKIKNELEDYEEIYEYLNKLKKQDYEILMMRLNENTAQFETSQLISSIYKRQDETNFAKIFDDTLIGIAKKKR